MVLDENTFLTGFKKATDHGVNYDPCVLALGKRLDPKRRKTFDKFVRIMTAKSTKDLQGLSLSDVLDCMEEAEEFSPFFEGRRAGSYLDPAEEMFKTCINQRKRRVL